MAESDSLDWGKRRRTPSDSDDDDDEGMTTQAGTAGTAGAAAHEYYDPQNEEENADMSVLDYDYSSVQEKISAGLKEKAKGNKLFTQGKYEEAWKQYDRCFVQVYTSKEEWLAIGAVGRKAVNDFKLPCHLNRGLCRLRKDDVTNALWDFSEALRIDDQNVKGLFRKGVTLIRMIQLDLEKEGTDELWDLDVSDQRSDEAKSLLMKAAKMAPNDTGVRKGLADLKVVNEKLAAHRKKYREDQRKMYSSFISNLDRDNQKLKEDEDKSIFDDMPKLERVRIE